MNESSSTVSNGKSEQLPELSPEAKPRSRWIWIGCILLVIASAMHAANCKIGGGDTWVAMALGRYTANDWSQNQPNRTWQMHLLDKIGIHMTQRDPISAKTRTYDPVSRSFDSMSTRLKAGLSGADKSTYDPRYEHVGWINQNWLTHLLFYKMKTAFGGDELKPQHAGESLIVAYKMIQAILTALLAYWAARVLGAHPVLASGCAAFGILLSRSFIDLRPNVSSILFAAAMIVVLAYWRRGRHRALFWMIPIMIIWSNVHGGFIYGIMIFWLVFVAYLVNKWAAIIWPGSFVNPSGKSLCWLFGAAVVVTLIPGIFSPFGGENLIHPFGIATGSEGKVWRNVIEWRPISDPKGFGHAAPYVYFLVLFGLTFLARWLLFFFKPPQPELRKRRQRRAIAEIPWPKINLAHLGIIAITMIMSIKSRRFIFLGGVVLAPFLAQLMQDIVNMLRILVARAKKLPLELLPMARSWVAPLATLSFVAFILVSSVFAFAMNDIYLKDPLDADDLSIFRRMVGLPAQPVDAIAFFNDNKIKGVVFNEWVQGGFISYHQQPDPETGSPATKVHMDGRSQAAYEIRHFQWWQRLRHIIRPGGRKSDGGRYTKEFCDKLNRNVKQFAAAWGLKVTDPALLDKFFQDSKYSTLFGAALANAALYNAVLTRDGVNVVLLSRPKSESNFLTLMASGNWRLVYFDHKYNILLRKDSPLNRDFFERERTGELVFADDYTKKLITGTRLCRARDPVFRRQGLDMLMSLKFTRFVPLAYDRIHRTAVALGEHQKLWNYLAAEYAQLKKSVDAEERFGMSENVARLLHVGRIMQKVAPKLDQQAEAAKIVRQRSHYRQLREELFHSASGKGHLLW